jgi:hypothetical protein
VCVCVCVCVWTPGPCFSTTHVEMGIWRGRFGSFCMAGFYLDVFGGLFLASPGDVTPLLAIAPPKLPSSSTHHVPTDMIHVT